MRDRPAALAVVAALLFAGMALFAKAASAEVAPAELGFVRAAFGILACGLYALHTPLRPVNTWGLAHRGISGAIAVYLYFTAIAHLPVGMATLLNYTAPVFTALWCAALYGERVAKATLGALALSTLGIVLVLRGRAEDATGVGVYELVGVCGAIVSGLALALITEARRTDGPWEIFGAFSLGCLVVTAPEALLHWHTPSPRAWLLLAAMGVFSVAAQVIMTWSMGFLNATLSGVINQLTPVTSLTLGAFLFGDRFGVGATLGTALTLVGGIYGAWLARKPTEQDCAGADPSPWSN